MLSEQKQFIKATLTKSIDTDVIVSPSYIRSCQSKIKFIKGMLTMRIDINVIVSIPPPKKKEKKKKKKRGVGCMCVCMRVRACVRVCVPACVCECILTTDNTDDIISFKKQQFTTNNTVRLKSCHRSE